MIAFNVPPVAGNELEYVRQAVMENRKHCGDGPFTKRCNEWMETTFRTPKVLLTTSCTHALEMAALLCQIEPGDEVIVPSYTFVSTVNAFVLRGATIVFVDIRPDTMNIDERLIEAAITSKTKAIVPVHYAGVACEMDTILAIASQYSLFVVEDAAQGVMAAYKGKALGTIGDLGCYSFHETKNYSMGEGGALLVQREEWRERAEIIREKGTNRSRFLRGQVDKYTWVDIGSSFLPADINAAFLYAQLEMAGPINENRLASWKAYEQMLQDLQQAERLELPYIPNECTHNAHMFYVKCRDLDERTKLLSFLKDAGIVATFHYVPLHSAEAGPRYSRFHGADRFTTKESERLLRLPLYYNISVNDIERVSDAVHRFFR